MTIICHHCGKPLELQDIPASIQGFLRTSLLKIAAGVVHEKCGEEIQRNLNEPAEAYIAAQRLKHISGVVPPAFQDTKEDRLCTSECHVALCWTWGNRGLMMGGPTGTGKSRCAFELARREHLAGRAVVTTTHYDFYLSAMKVNDYGQRNTALKWIDLIKDCDLLVIDDLGKMRMGTNSGEFTQATALLWDVLDYRCKQRKPFIITTNLAGKDLEATLGTGGEALVRRLREFCDVINFTRKLQ